MVRRAIRVPVRVDLDPRAARGRRLVLLAARLQAPVQAPVARRVPVPVALARDRLRVDLAAHLPPPVHELAALPAASRASAA